MIAGAYFWATAYNSGAAPMSASVSFYARPEAMGPGNDHSLTEMLVKGNRHRTYEVGVMTDPTYYGDTGQHLFVSSWDASGFLGLDTGFKPTSATRPGALVGGHAYTSYGFTVADGQVRITLNGRTVGHYDAPGFRTSSVSVYGEAYAEGKPLPQMRGSVRNYRTSTHSTLTTPAASPPYRITGHSPTGFSFK
jgi:hypothetical protein